MSLMDAVAGAIAGQVAHAIASAMAPIQEGITAHIVTRSHIGCAGADDGELCIVPGADAQAFFIRQLVQVLSSRHRPSSNACRRSVLKY
ncbi:MAG: hypothetical protein BGN87_07110 [Rhizobiales bacterium 65-79]|mgnify:CR=1 FL=1|jgi:hypothetical protein|nr:MAG: hypothetical protein BGN87_07110 [Rhizobiales bacterium 65-79]